MNQILHVCFFKLLALRSSYLNHENIVVTANYKPHNVVKSG